MALFHIITFGCQMNVNDSQWLSRALKAKGHEESSPKEADFFILNTCSVREKPEKNVHSAIGRMRKNNPDAWVAVMGCVAQQLGTKLFQQHKKVRLVLGADAIHNAPDAIEKILEEDAKAKPFTLNTKQSMTDFIDSFPDREHYLNEIQPEDTQPVAYVNIMQGCDNFCAYCIVPYTRGKPKSRSTESIMDECKAWLDKGVKEIHLLGQNVNAFGLDRLNDGISFPDLLRKINKLQGLKRLRYITPHPRDFADETMNLFGELETLCPRLHIPLQSASDTVLERMRRGYTFSHFMNLIEKTRKVRPDIVFATDLIVGFPNETEEEFNQTLHSLSAVPFIHSYSFPYSDRPNTLASKMQNKIPAQLQLERLEILQATQKDIGAAYLETLVGTKASLLIEGKSKKSNSAQARDIYGNTVHIETKAPIGSIIDANIVEAQRHSVVAKES